MSLPKLKKLLEEIEGILKDPSISEKDVDPKELQLGIKVEMEHTNDPKVAKIIALHHLAEMPDYYTRLIAMEKGNKFKKEEGVVEFFGI